jgi:hypothetical protein
VDSVIFITVKSNAMSAYILGIVLSCAGMIYTASNETTYDILHGDKIIGKVIVSEENNGEHYIRHLKSESSARFIFSIKVKTSYKITRNKNGDIIDGEGFREANMGNQDVQAHTRLLTPNKYSVQRNGEAWIRENQPIEFCVADMYFEEPVGRSTIYSNMYGQDLKLVHEGDHRYHLITPDNKGSYFVYKNGVLTEVTVSTPIGNVMTRRK